MLSNMFAVCMRRVSAPGAAVPALATPVSGTALPAAAVSVSGLLPVAARCASSAAGSGASPPSTRKKYKNSFKRCDGREEKERERVGE